MANIRDISLVVEAPRQGVAQSPHIGFGSVVNLDITSVPGIVQLNNILVKKSGSTVTATINWFVRHPITTTEIYAIDNAGTVYKSTDTGATWAILAGSSSTNAHGNGIWIWKNYLFIARDAFLDVCGDGTATGITAANWTLGWKAIDSDINWHPMYTSRNDSKLYGGAGRFVFSLDENTGKTFAPGTPATYTWTQQALDLPTSYRIKCVEELGNNLMLGTWQGTNVYDIRLADIFPWDRSSVSFGQPINIADFGIHAMKNINQTLIILAGTNGTVFRSDGVNTVIIAQLPQDLSGGKYLEWYPGSICSYKNKVFFGSGNGGSTAIGGQGVYSLQQTGKGNILSLEHLASSLDDGTSDSVKITALLPVSRDTILVGSQSNTSYAIDLTTDTSYAYTTDYSGYFESPLYVVGETDFLASYLKLQFRLAKKLNVGEGIQIYYRNNLTDTYTLQGTYTYAQLGGVISHQTQSNILPCEMLQIKVALLGTGTTTPQFKSLRLEDYFMRGSQATNQK